MDMLLTMKYHHPLITQYKNTCVDAQDFNKHSSAVLHFDFSSDSRYFQSNCQAAEVKRGTQFSPR